MLRTATEAYHLNREGLVFARGHLKLTALCQRRTCVARSLPLKEFHPIGVIGCSTQIFRRLEKHFFVIRPKLHALCLLALCVFAESLLFTIHALLCPNEHGFRYWVTF